jgi:DUF438 domain-containing protein
MVYYTNGGLRNYFSLKLEKEENIMSRKGITSGQWNAYHSSDNHSGYVLSQTDRKREIIEWNTRAILACGIENLITNTLSTGTIIYELKSGKGKALWDKNCPHTKKEGYMIEFLDEVWDNHPCRVTYLDKTSEIIIYKSGDRDFRRYCEKQAFLHWKNYPGMWKD